VLILCVMCQWKFPLTMVRTGLEWFLAATGPAASSHLESGAFVRSRPDVPFPDIQIHFLPSVIIDHGQKMGDFHAFQASCWFFNCILEQVCCDVLTLFFDVTVMLADKPHFNIRNLESVAVF